MEPRLSLTPPERLLCSLLDATCTWVSSENPAIEMGDGHHTFTSLAHPPPDGEALTCEARIAGGWVRDKLLERPSHDLDVSLSTLTGHTFALFLRAYLDTDAFKTSALASDMLGAAGQERGTMSQIGKIAANPEQSKNLETATARVLNFELDFVNLRKEEYQGTSRIPVMSFGTPLEDALRRDITVNTLFYNVHTGLVEDWTQQGLPDIQEGIVRTPMDPAETFSDDPLRILRCIRFASRFVYTIHPSIRACLRGEAYGTTTAEEATRTSAALRESLLSKVSRERFGIEIEKMLQGPDPLRALQLISELGLYDIVFLPPPQPAWEAYRTEGESTEPFHPGQLSPSAALASGGLLAEIYQGTRWNETLPAAWLEAVRADPGLPRLLWFAVALLPLRDVYIVQKKGELWIGHAVIASGLKLGTRNTKDPVAGLYRAARLLHRPRLDKFPAPDQHLLTQVSSIGLLLANPNVSEPRLGLSLAGGLLFALLCDLLPYWHQDGDAPVLDEGKARLVLDEYAAFWNKVVGAHLDAPPERPVLDGNQIATALHCEKILIPRIKPFVFAWQLDHAEPSEPAARQEACTAWLQEQWAAGEIVPENEREPLAPQTKKRQKQ